MEKEVVKKRRDPLVIAFEVLYATIIIILGFFGIDYVVIAAFVLLIPYLILLKRSRFIFHALISFLVALTWMSIAKDFYGYGSDYFVAFGINLFPMFAWAGGLFALYVLYLYINYHLKKKGFLKNLLLFVVIYWVLLIIAETVAYHTFGIHNLATATYKGLPICNCLHVPTWIKIAYFSNGIIYFIICYLLNIERMRK